MKTETEFHSGSPPHIGWFLCNCDWWRWFDGKLWSYGAKEGANTRRISFVLRKKVEKKLSLNIRWSHYYPENARVPRIDPLLPVRKPRRVWVNVFDDHDWHIAYDDKTKAKAKNVNHCKTIEFIEVMK